MFGRFFLPGPTEVRPEVLAAMNQPEIGHRGPEISALLSDADPRLRRIFSTARPVYVSTSSATGLMELAVRNGVEHRALSLVNGAFSTRFRDLVEACSRQADTYEVEWGEAHEPGEVERLLLEGDQDAVTVVHSETSTGVLNPVREIAKAVQSAERRSGRQILLLVDGVSSVGGTIVETDGWGVDWFLTGSQKAFALPPGLAFGTPSARMLDRAARLPGRGQYFDLLELDRYWKKHQTPSTPAVNLIYALVEQLRHMDAEGMAARAKRHAAMAQRCWDWAEETGRRWGMSILAPAGRRSPTVSALRAPAERPGSEIAARMKERGYTIAPGYGKLRDATIRIGHMGDHTVAELDPLLSTLEEVLEG